MVVLVCTTRKIKPIRVCAKSHGLETSVKWVSIGITVYESKNYYSRSFLKKLNL